MGLNKKGMEMRVIVVVILMLIITVLLLFFSGKALEWILAMIDRLF